MLNEQWERIKAISPAREGTACQKGKDDRVFVRTVLWIARSGSPWQALPEQYGKWSST